MTTASRITRPRSTQTTAIGLVIAALAVLAIIPIRAGQDAGFALVLGPLLLLSAALVWRFGLPGHIWAAVVGVLLLLMHGSYAVAGLTDKGELRVILLDAAIAGGAAVALFGSVSYLASQRSRRA